MGQRFAELVLVERMAKQKYEQLRVMNRLLDPVEDAKAQAEYLDAKERWLDAAEAVHRALTDRKR